MEERLKTIEEKLGILLAAMSGNPEFEKFVKEGQLKLHMVKFEKELHKNIYRTPDKELRVASELIQNASPRFFSRAFIHTPSSPEYAEEMSKIMSKIKELIETDTQLQEHLDRILGFRINIEAELEKERLRYLEENK